MLNETFSVIFKHRGSEGKERKGEGVRIILFSLFCSKQCHVASFLFIPELPKINRSSDPTFFSYLVKLDLGCSVLE